VTRPDPRTDAQARLALLARTSEIFDGAREQGQALRLLAGLLVPSLGEWCGIDLLSRDEVTLRRQAEAGSGPVAVDAAHGPGVVVRTGEPQLTPQLLCVPITHRDRLLGTLTVRSDGPVYGMEDVDLARYVAARTAEAIESAQLHRSLARSEQRYRMLFDQSPLPMWVYDVETLRFLAVNDAAIRHYGYTREEFLGMRITDIRPPEDVDALLESIDHQGAGSPIPGAWKHQHKDGSLIDVEITAGRVTFDGDEAALVLAHDVSERRQLEQRLVEAERMEAIGRLAGGVAHDFNNLLTIIHGYASVLREREDGASEELTEILHATEQASSLTREMLAFSRRQVMHATIVDVNDIVAGMQSMLQRIIGDDVSVGVRFGQALAPVEADRAQIERVILNLAANARDAMPHGGRLTIETANVDLDEDYVSTHGDGMPGPHVMLAVSDTGTGMPEEVRRHLFEPFFTTKPLGVGTGLGLATVFGVVKQSGGSIFVYSEEGAGTTFKIYLPAASDAALLADDHPAGELSVEGSETVMVVEDDARVRDLVRIMLEGAGYDVRLADDPTDAERACARGGIDLVLTDVVMPGVSGQALAERIAAVSPSTRILFMSGYSDEAVVHNGIIRADAAFIEKPFSSRALTRKVRETLSRTGPR
jgi:two-component system, cell cycle sensor histidine kinase and response regulator CckA